MTYTLEEISTRFKEIALKPKDEITDEEKEFIKQQWSDFKNQIGLLWESLATCTEMRDEP